MVNKSRVFFHCCRHIGQRRLRFCVVLCAGILHSIGIIDVNLQGGPKKVSLIIFAITLSTASQFS